MNKEIELSSDEQLAISQINSINAIQETMQRFLDTADVDVVYGEPVQNGDVLVLPSAEVLCGMGFGVGAGRGGDEASETGGEGGGGGGGGRVLSRPVAVVIITPDSVRVEPVIDPTKIALAALTAAGFMAGMFFRMLRGANK